MAAPLHKLPVGDTFPANEEIHDKAAHLPEEGAAQAIQEDAQLGIKKVQAIREAHIWSKWSTIWLWGGMFLLHFIQAFEGSTTFLYIPYATSSFKQHSLLGTAGTVASLTSAIAQPVVSKLSDVIGRAEACILSVVVYTCGMILYAASKGIGSYAGGNIMDSLGQTGIQLLIAIIIGDLLPLRWRSLVYYGLALDWILFAFVGANVGASVISGPGWRWGYGVFAICIPICCAPVIGALVYSQVKARRLGVLPSLNPTADLVKRSDAVDYSFSTRLKSWAREIDVVGLILLAAGWCCLLLPLTLANKGTLPFSNYKIIIMLTLGPILLIAFTFWEARFATSPCLPARFFANRNVALACSISFFSSIAYYLQYLYQYSFLYVTKPDWSVTDLNYFAQIQTVSTTVFAITAGGLVAYYRWYKVILIVGLCIRLLGLGLMIHSRGANGNTAELVWSQLLQGWGWGFYAAICQTVVQASVSTKDLATVTAFFLLIAKIGSSIGNTITTAIWRDMMPKKLAEQLLPFTNQTTVDTVFGSITYIATLDASDPVRIGSMRAYDQTMLILVILATVFAIPPIIMAICMKDLRLDHRFSAFAAEGETSTPAHQIKTVSGEQTPTDDDRSAANEKDREVAGESSRSSTIR